ncbi:MAG: hypothetical protein QM687_00695 [Ferruginibacter sp.]
MNLLQDIDLLLCPLYIVLLGLLMNWYRKRFVQKELGLLFLKGFYVKMFFSIAFVLFSAFLVPGDTEMYYTAGIDFKKIVVENPDNLHFIFGPAKKFGEYYEAKGYRPENYGYINAASNLTAIKFVALFSIFSFNSYTVINLFFGTLSFLGLWYMFMVFYRLYPHLYKLTYRCFFFIPSVLFWGSGILKDTLCICFLGIGFFCSYIFFIEKKQKGSYLLIGILSFFFLFTIKSYIAISFIASFIAWYFFRYLQSEKSALKKMAIVAIPSVLIIGYMIFGNPTKDILQDATESMAENMMETQKLYTRFTPDDGALLDYGEIIPTPAGILKVIPKALVASLFRPFLWEAKKATSLIAGLEGTALFLLTCYVFLRRGPIKPLYIIFTDNTVFFCFLFSIVFAIAIGLNCFNLGALVRYKIPCLPFYTVCMTLILKNKKSRLTPA